MSTEQNTNEAANGGSALNDLLYGGNSSVPTSVAMCPECGGRLHAESAEWDSETGIPTIDGFYVDCESDPDCNHRYWQSDWQPVIDRIGTWIGAEAV